MDRAAPRPEPPESAEFWRLVEAACRGELGPEGRVQLESLLESDRRLKERYVAYLSLHAELQWRFSRGSGAQRPAFPACQFADEGAGDLLDGLRLPDVSSPGNPFQWRPSLWKLGRLPVIGLTFVVVLGLLWLGAKGFWPGRVPQGGAGQAQLAPPAVKEQAPWAAWETVALRVQSGSTTVQLPGIGQAVLESPARFEMLGPMRARLSEGRIRVHVTEQSGRGFVVETPHGEVIDLGTEFGIDVTGDSGTGVVVFQGAVDLSVAEKERGSGKKRVTRLHRGEGLTVRESGQVDRIMSIVTGDNPTFLPSAKAAMSETPRVIAQVADNIGSSEVRKFYEIVPGGLREDALAYVDRPGYQWNGMTVEGMPSYLAGGDYVKPFNDDKVRRDLQISVALSCPARLFVFLFDDDRWPGEAPSWLRERFTPTGDYVGLDVTQFVLDGKVVMQGHDSATGAGKSIDHRFSVWETTVAEPGVVVLGPNKGDSFAQTSMYGIAAVALDSDDASGMSKEGGHGEGRPRAESSNAGGGGQDF